MIEFAELVGVSCFRYRGGRAPAPYGLRLEFDTSKGKRYDQLPTYPKLEERLLSQVGTLIPIRHRAREAGGIIYHDVRIHQSWLRSIA